VNGYFAKNPRVEDVAAKRGLKECAVADLTGEDAEEDVGLHPDVPVVAVEVVKEAVVGVEAMDEESLGAGLGLCPPILAVFAELLRDQCEIPALAGDVGREVGRDQRQQRVVGVVSPAVVPERRVGDMPEARGEIVAGVERREGLDAAGTAGVAIGREPRIVARHRVVHRAEEGAVAAVELIVVPDAARERRHDLDLVEGGTGCGQLVGQHAVVTLVFGEGGVGRGCDRGHEPRQDLGVDRPRALEPAAEIDAALVEDRRRVVRRLDAGEELADGAVVLRFHMRGRRREADAGCGPFAEFE
jgi:hypothetical protein